jgi:hypothetical protein
MAILLQKGDKITTSYYNVDPKTGRINAGPYTGLTLEDAKYLNELQRQDYAKAQRGKEAQEFASKTIKGANEVGMDIAEGLDAAAEFHPLYYLAKTGYLTGENVASGNYGWENEQGKPGLAQNAAIRVGLPLATLGVGAGLAKVAPKVVKPIVNKIANSVYTGKNAPVNSVSWRPQQQGYKYVNNSRTLENLEAQAEKLGGWAKERLAIEDAY